MTRVTQYQTGDKIGQHFKVYKSLAGGMGEVYLCIDESTNVPLALKTFQSRFNNNLNLREAFNNEIAIWISLEGHPNIVRCFRLETIDNKPFILHEWVAGDKDRGTSLRDWISQVALDLRTALQITIDICCGFIHAISKQPTITHCDINPNNILLSSDGIAKITDFGLSTIKGEFKGGTAFYKAPEQWLGEKLDFRTDIYAVGCTLYEMLVGHPPFASSDESKLRNAHLNSSIPKIKLNQQSKEINEILLKCLSKKRNDRFNSFQDLLSKLQKAYIIQFKRSPRIILAGVEYSDWELVERGATYDSLKFYELALDDYNSSIKLNPHSSSAYNNRGTTYLHLEMYQEAISDFEVALKYEPTLANAFVNLGIIYHKILQFEKATQSYTRAIELNPHNPLAYYNRSITYETQEELDKAISDLTKAIELNPKYVQALNNRGSLYDKMNQHAEAFIDYNKAISFDPTLTEAYMNRGTSYYHWGEYEKALSDYNFAIRLDDRDADAYYNRGNTHLRMNSIKDALEDLQKAIKLNPRHWKSYKNIGSILQAIGRFNEAQFYINKAEQLRE